MNTSRAGKRIGQHPAGSDRYDGVVLEARGNIAVIVWREPFERQTVARGECQSLSDHRANATIFRCWACYLKPGALVLRDEVRREL